MAEECHERYNTGGRRKENGAEEEGGRPTWIWSDVQHLWAELWERRRSEEACRGRAQRHVRRLRDMLLSGCCHDNCEFLGRLGFDIKRQGSCYARLGATVRPAPRAEGRPESGTASPVILSRRTWTR